MGEMATAMSADEFAAHYREHAASCVDIAQRISDTESKMALFATAQSWLALAEQTVKNSETVPGLRNPYTEANARLRGTNAPNQRIVTCPFN
jgi:hypothetical protein